LTGRGKKSTIKKRATARILVVTTPLIRSLGRVY